AIGRAPYRFRLLGELWANDREHEDIDGDVVDLLQRLLELLARRAVGIGEHRHDALAVAALHLHRLVERQRFELDGVQLARPLFGHVAVVLRVVDLADEDVRGVCVRIDDTHAAARRAKADFVQAERTGLYALDLDAAELLLHHPADLRFVRERAGHYLQQRHCGAYGYRALHVSSSPVA